jgi:hypothetical protein
MYPFIGKGSYQMKRLAIVAIITIIAILFSACTYHKSPAEASTPTRYGGAPDHISYKYTELDSENNIFQITFEKYNGDYEGDYDFFLLDGVEVTKSEYDEIAEKYLNIGSDSIIWSDYWTFLCENANRN